MKSLVTFKVVLAFVFLLITNSVSSNGFNKKLSYSDEVLNFSTLSLDGISPNSGHAGTIVTITGTGFTPTSLVLLGTITIPTSNIQFVSATELKITVPCGVTSGTFTVDGISSTILFTYIEPTISTVLPNLSYCVGATVPQIILSGTPTVPTTPTALQFTWSNTNTTLGLIGNGVGNLPTFTAINATSEPISSTIIVTPSINGCSGLAKNYAITVNPKPVPTAISNISVCAGATVSQINLTAISPNSGTGTSFSWSGTNNAAIGLSTASGITSPIPSFTAANATNGLLSSIFTVTPTFQTCVGLPINFTIDVAPQSLGGTLASNGSVCSGNTSGILSLSGYRGVILNWESSTTGGAPWTSIANTAATYQSGGLTQTTYFRVAVQNSGCPIVYSNTVTVTVNSLPTIIGNLSVCNGTTTTLSGSANPATTPWQSSNLGIATISNTGLVTGISPGTTIITYTNSNGCSITANFVVNASPTVLVTNPTPVCIPNTVDLTSASITTGSSLNLTYTYFTNSGATIALVNPNAVATSGTYYIKGTDSNGCSSVSVVSALINSLPSISVAGVTSICADESTTLTASGANTYAWSGGFGTNASINITPLITTTYTVNATNNNGCVGTATATVIVKPLPTVDAGLDRSVCIGLPVTLVGTGTGVASYSWDNAVTNNVSFTPSATTLYTVTGLGTNGCFNTDSVLVTVNALPTAPILNIVQPNCVSNLGIIQFSGLPTIGNWTINPGSYNGSGATYTLNNQPPGAYTFSVKNSNLCTSVNAAVTINAAPIVPAIPTVGTITQPGCITTTGSVVLSGLPSGNWTITKLPGGQTYTNTGNSYTVTNLATGTYTFSVSNGTCSSSSSQNVVIDAAPIQSAPIDGLIVQPTCTTPTGSVTLSGLPTGNWTLTRIPDGVQLSNSGNSTTISGLVTGTYNFTVTNASGCTSLLSNAIVINSQPASPSAPIANAQSFLASANATISNLQIVSPGTPIWYANAVGGTAISGSTLLATGIYYASQTINGCESITRTAVNVSVFPSSTGGSVSGTTTVCFGTNSTVLTLSGYTGSILRWESSTVSDFSANVLSINIQSTTYTATNLTGPLYFRAVVQSGISPVDYSSPAFIDVVAQSSGGNLTASTSVCLGQNSGLLSVSGYVGTIVRWEQSVDNGVNWTSIANTTNTFTSGALLVTTQYRVAVQNGVCPAVFSSVATITVKNTPVVTDFPNQQVCFGDTKTFGDPFVAGYTYSWTSDIGYTSILPQISITFGQVVTQTYTYTVTNSVTGCSAQDQFQVIVNPLPSATVIGNTTICEGNSIAIGSNSTIGSTYSWTSTPSGFISSISNPSVNPAVTTTYTLEETITATTCKKTNSVAITVQPIPVITIVGSPQFNICETTSQVQLNATITNLYSSFVWTKIIGSGSFDNSTILNPIYSPSIADVLAGSVTLRLSVIGANPCVATYTQDVIILIDKKPIANAGLDVTTCGINPIQINATGTLNASNLVWTLPSGISGTLNQSNPYTPIFTPSANDVNYVGPIVISLTASSNTTCPSSSDTVSVLITPAPIVDAGPPTAIICEGSNYVVPVNSATAQYTTTILWTKGTGDGTIVGANLLTPTYIPGANDIANGTVTLTLSASGNNPCNTPATDNIIITIVKNPIVNAGPDTTVCEGAINVNANIQNAGLIVWTVQNGNGNFVDPSAISPVYIPVPSDLNTTVTFVVNVTPINNCGPIISDSVLYTINAAPSVVAAGNATICQSNATYQLQATATNTTSITWTSTGSGSFDNIHNEDPIYTLSPGDVNAGSVTFTITGIQSLCANVTDTMVLTIQKNPTANAGLAQVICQGDMVVLPGSATNSNVFNWIRNGGSGTFINTNTTNPTYTSQLSESGSVDLILIASAIFPCTVPAQSETTITIIPKAMANAGSDAQICEGDSYHITSAVASNNIGLQWSTNGDGTFTGGSTLDPTYTPGSSDKNNGTVILTLVATKNFPCNANAVDQMTLTINKIPVITVINPDVDLCVGDPSYSVSGVVPTNYDTLSWSTSGSGTFAPNNSALAPTYFPSASDYTLGTVTLTLTASRNPLNCNSSTSNTITLHFIKKPTVDAGPVSATICEGSFYVTNGAIATNDSNVTWSTSGSGTFINATTFLATYTPSAADYNLGFVNLTLTANPLTPCLGTSTDVIRLNLQRVPVIIVRANDTICFTQNSYQIGGTSVVNYIPTSELWTTSGTGTFSPTIDPLNPIYNPSTDDLAAGFVTLTITVNSISPCINQASKSFVLTFQKLPVASAGPTIIACDVPFQITTATATLSTVSNLVWSTSGTGTFDYTNVLDPIYTPTIFDVENSPIILTLTANAIAPCTVPSVTTVQLNIVNSPVITVTPVQATICEDATNVTVLGTTVLYASNYIWTSATGTIISNNTIQNPIVTPSAQDITNNQIVLTITAQPLAPCGVPVSKTVTIPIQKKPSVFAGTSQTICENTIITTSDALSSNVTNLRWANNGGDGIFTTSNLNTITEYSPGFNEIASGQVLLTIIGDAIAPCSGTVTNTVTHTIIKNPIVTLNSTEVTICETQTTYTVPSTFVTLVNPSSILNYQWTTPNMASLTGASTWTPTYTPTAADVATGFVYLTLTVNPILPCAIPIVKTLKINISKQATITFTNDGFFCENISKPLSATFVNYEPNSISWAIVNGTGSITGGDTATPTYVPASDSGTVVIRISVASLAPCTNTVTQDFTITVVKKPIVAMTTISDTVCSSQLTYNLSGNTTQFANTILWTRVNPVGTGTFSNATLPNPVYTFNAADIANGFVTLRLTASSTANCNLTDFKEITINITKAPTVVTAPTDTVCQGSVFSTSATATDNASVLWSTVGTSNGLFANANQLVTQYTPGSNDTTSFTIQITALGNAPCASVSASKVVTIQQQPILDAGLENRANCSNQPYQITGVTGQNLGTILWTSNSGAPGTFSNATSLNPTYTPSATELSAGLPIVLTVTAQAVVPCTIAVSDFIILNLTPNQVVDAGTYSSICEGASVSLIGNATNAISVNWTSSGTGAFSAVNALNTNYVPSNSDIINGSVTLTLHAISDSNCPEVADSTVITILKKPIANAGANVSICQGSSYTLSAGDASAQNYSSITWTATGPGILNLNPINPLRPTYVPAIGQTGIVTLTLTATGYSECGINAVSIKTITIVPSPFSTIPSTKTICEGETLTLSNTDASAINYSSLLWSSNGLGSFTPNNTAATIYTPALGQTGLVTLSLTANSSNGVCPSYVSSLLLDIIAKPVVESGTNGTICQSQSFAVTGASVQNSTLYSWSVSGPATIQSGTGIPNVFPIIPPVIIPNAGASGTVTVTLTAVGTGICPVVISDFLTIQINPILVVNAGTDGTLCEGISSIQLNGTALNANSYTWTTTGGGTIQQTGNPLAPLYVPSASDYATATGIKVITINLNAATTNGCSAVSDAMQLTLYAKPKVNAGIDLLACQDSSSVLLNGATVSNYNSGYTVSWSSSGNGTWDYTNSNGGINPVYIFGSNDTSSVTLTMSALPNSICPQVAVTDAMVVTINQNPAIVTTSNEITMCGETFTMPDLVTVNNGNSILWTNTTGVSGTPGVLTNATTETPIFTPSANEIANGFALLTLTALPQSGCSLAAVTVIKVNLQPKAIVNAGANITACQGEIITVNNGASVQNYTTYSWSENGTGTIDSATINSLNPKYYPGANETGVITFALQATNLLPCAGLVTQTMTVTISSQPTVNAGPDATICQNTNYTLGSATVANNATVLWTSSQNSNGTSSGTYVGGTFSNTTIIDPVYTPSQDDINLGYVYLTVRANSTLCSSLVSDVIKITISKATTVAAGSDATICEGTNFTLATATQTYATSLVWTSSQNSNGTSSPTYVSGSFSSTSILNPIYTPSIDDINLGQVYLTLSGSGSSNCPIATSQLLLNIVKKPTVSTTDVQMCMNTPQITLNGFATNYQSYNWSIYSGPGSISPNLVNPLNPTFISGISGLSTVQTTVVRLYVTPYPGCPQATAVYDDLVITIQPLPTVEAGVNGSVCYVSGQPIAPFAVNGTSVTNASSQNWTSSGVGIFTVGTPVLYQSLSNSCTSDVLTLTATGIGACSTSTVTDSVILTVNCSIPSLGTITSNTPTTICQGSTATYSIPANTNVQSYTWSVPTGATIQSGQGTNTIQVLYSSASSGNVAVTGANGCGSVIATLPITVNSLPTGVSISGSQSVCAGDSNIVYTATLIPNATSYVWTLPNGSIITTATNTITISYALTAISGNLSVSGNNTCGAGTVSAAFPITINPQPSLSSSLTPPAICSGAVFNYVPTSIIVGTTFAWTRATQLGISNPAVGPSSGTINEVLVNTTSNPILVVYQVTITTPQGCTSTQNVNILVNPSPSLTSSATPSSICTGATFNYTPTSASIGTITWTRALQTGISNPAVGPLSGTINEVLTNTTNLPITVVYNLTIPATANGCTNSSPVELNVDVNPNNTVTAASSSPTICINSALTAITHTTTGATGIGTITGLPAGVTASWLANTITISGAPTVSGTFNYSILLTGGCSTVYATGSIIVNPNNTVTPASSTPTICINTAITAITNTTTGATGIGVATGLPIGITASWAGNIITISGTPTVSGIFNYSIPLTGGCGLVNSSGTIIVNPNNTVTAASSSPTICINSALTAITHTTTGATGIGTITGLPAGVTASWLANTITISGAPTVSGTFNYSILLTGGCSTVNATGTIIVNPNNTVTVASSLSTICINAALTVITHTTTGATGIGAATNLPTGVSALWSANTITISGTPSVSGTFNYSIPLTGGCSTANATGTIIVNPDNTVTAASSSPTICINTVLTTITHTTIGATGIGAAAGLPAGVSASWAGNTIAISGAPTVSGIFNYSIPLTGGCSSVNATGTIIVNPNNTVTPASSTPTICINTVLTPITHTTIGAAGIGAIIGLPAGVSASWAGNTITISGAPTASGIFNYSIPLTGGCSSVNASGTIIVNPNNTVTPASSSPTICINTALTPITHITTGATGIGSATGFPTGVTASWAANTITINGAPTASGTFNYSIPLTGGCGIVNATGTIIVNPDNTFTAGSSSPTICINTVLTPITHTTLGATGIGATAGLPAGVSALWSANTITISGTPTVSGTFNYSIPLTGGCNTVNATGTIIVNPNNIVTLGSSTPTICINTVLTPITHTTIGATGIGAITGLPAGVSASWAGNTITISGAPTASGIFNYSIPLTGGCSSVNATGTIIVDPNNTVTSASSSPTICINTVLTPITHITTGATGIGLATGLPAGVTATWVANTITISGTPSVSGTFNYSIPLTGGCGGSTTGTIIVNPNNTVTPASSSPTICINTALTAISHTTTGASGIGAVTNLPLGVTASLAGNIITISGTPTVSGIFNYSIPLTGGCSTVNATGTIIVDPNNTVTLGSSSPTICINSVLTPITHTSTGATGIGAITGLPIGVTASWAGNIITISGTASASGIFNYSIPLTGGCSTIYATGTIIVNPNNTVTAATSSPTICINSALTAITHTTTGATGIGTATGLPTGVTASWSANTITISGTPTVSGTFNYSVLLTGGCSTVYAIGSIIVNPNNTVSPASSSPTICINTALTAITHITTVATGIGTATGLPAGVSALWSANTITISGTPTVSGTFNYSIPLTGGCSSIFATGSIIVDTNNTVTPGSSSPTICINTVLTSITHTTTGATGIGAATGLPAGVTASWLANTITISGMPTVSGSFNYSIPLTGGCGGSATGSIIVDPNNTVTPGSSTPTICINTVLTPITHTTTGATGIGLATGLPIGVSASWSANTITISGTPTVSGIFNYSILLTGGCSTVYATGSIIVNPNNTVTPASSSPTICTNTALTAITHTTTVATGIGTATGLPAGVTALWSANTITISGTPTVSGTFNYNIPLTGGCSSIFATGSIIVNPSNTVTVGSSLPTICINSVLTPITHTTTGATGIGAATGFPAGVTASWAGNIITISGIPTVSGSFNYSIPLTGGCSIVYATGSINVNPQPIATITGTNNFVVCQNGTQPVVTFTASNGTAPYAFSYQINSGPILTVFSLASSNSASVSIPTAVPGNYTLTLLSIQDSSASMCNSTNITLPNTAFVTVQQVGTITPTNQAVVSQTVCQNTPITPVVFTIGGASTNAFVTNLPAGLSGSYTSGIFTISGIPLETGVFNYVVNTSGSTNGCNSTYTGTITVNSNDSILALVPATINQTVCNNVAIQPIVYNLGGGATGGIVTFSPPQPLGITWSILNNVITISGASNSIGTFTYTVQSFGICGQSTATGNLTINPSTTISLVSVNPNTTVCLGSSFALPIQYSIIPTSATMIVTGLPTGATFNAATGIISGTPSQSGTFPYTVSVSSGCGNVLSGVITVNPVQSISYVSGNTNQVACQYSSIDPINFTVSSGVNAITVSPALPAGISYSIGSGILTISGTPTAATSLAQNFTITTQGACGPQATYIVTFDIRPEATITFTTGSGSINQAVCQSAAIIPITFTIGGGATGIITSPLPSGLTLTFDALTGIYTIQGNPLVNGIFNFPITTTGCSKTVFITISNVNAAVGISLTSAIGTDNQTLCQTNFNSPIVPIVYTVIGATNVVVNGLPIGVTAVFSPTTGQLIITGTPTQPGIFNYTITSLPCSVVKAGVIRVSTPIFITNEVVTNISCSSSNDGAISVTIVGGVAFNGLYAVHWSGPNGFQQNQTTISGLQAGQYVLTGTDAIGCPIPTMTYTVLPAVPINIALQSSTNVSCNGILGCANFNITGGSGIYTSFTLQYLDPSSQTLMPITPANNNYFNICNLRAGLYYLTVRDSRNCATVPYLFTIYDYSSLSIETITMDTTLCQDTPGKIRIKVNSLDTNLSFYYNSVLVLATSLGNSIYELSIDNPTVPTGIIKVKNGQDCWVTTTVSTAIVTPDFEFTSNDFQSFGYYSVNGSVQFTNLVDMNNIPAEYDYVVWDFGDNTPFKVFYNPEDLLPNSDGENFETVFHTYTTNGIYQVTLTVYNQFGCFRKVTKTIVIGTGATMMLPTIFTPNGDGINDLFRPSLIGLKDVAMYIYDDWGNLVYEVSSEVSLLTDDWGWNGIEKGKTEPRNNDYRYYIIATTINDKKIEKEGRFLLVK